MIPSNLAIRKIPGMPKTPSDVGDRHLIKDRLLRSWLAGSTPVPCPAQHTERMVARFEIRGC